MWLIPTRPVLVKRAIDAHGVRMRSSEIRREGQAATSGWLIIPLGARSNAGTESGTAFTSPSRDTLLAVLASVGIALGLGAQDLVKNIIGGLVILVDRPYQLGDRVKIGDAYGEIDHIGLRSTKLTTPDDTRVTIPNSDILSGMAWNANSGVPDCQVITDLFVPHDTDPTEALEIGYEAAFSSPYLLLAKPVVVLLQDHFQHAPYLVVRIKAYVYDHRFEPRLQSDITMRAKAELLRRGILQRWRGYGFTLPNGSLNGALRAGVKEERNHG